MVHFVFPPFIASPLLLVQKNRFDFEEEKKMEGIYTSYKNIFLETAKSLLKKKKNLTEQPPFDYNISFTY